MDIFDKIKSKIEKNRESKEQYYSQSGANWFQTFFNTGVKGEYLTYKMINEGRKLTSGLQQWWLF